MISFDRMESLKQGLYANFKKSYKGVDTELGPSWDKCWVFISMMYPDYAFRSASTYYYRMATGAPELDNSWAKKGKEFWFRLCVTTEMYANGALASSLEGTTV